METRYKDIRNKIKTGDMMVLRNPGLITWTTKSPASHIGMLVWRLSDQNTLAVAESREGLGSRVVTLSSQVRKFPGRIDIYRPTGKGANSILRERAGTIAFNWSGRSYNYPGIFRLGIDNLPILRFIKEKVWGVSDRNDLTPSRWDEPKYCSQLYIWSYRIAKQELEFMSRWEPCPAYGDKWVTPAMLVSSPAFEKIAENLVP